MSEGNGRSNTSGLVILAVVAVFLLIVFSFPRCSSPARSSSTSFNIVVTQEAADGLDLQALFEVVADVESAEELERVLNEPDGINNMDLNDDNVVDFIKVSEYGSGTDGAYGFSLTTEPDAESGEQEIASIEIVTDGDQAEVEVRGNEQIYGGGYYYHGFYPVRSFLLWSYLTGPRVMYVSPWAYASYPGYYGRGYAPVSSAAYNNRTSSINSASTAARTTSSQVQGRSNLVNPNRGRSAGSGITQRLRQPTATQRSFQARSTTRSTTSTRSTSVRSTTRSRSSGGFGK